MKTLKYIFYLLTISFFVACEDVIELKTADVEPILSVDGTITNQPGTQKIKLTYSQKLLSRAEYLPYLGAKVVVTDNNNRQYEFVDKNNNGIYLWEPQNTTDTMGKVGNTYTLSIEKGTEKYTAKTELKRVTKVSYLKYSFKKDERPRPADSKSPKEGYETRFYANDFKGFRDCYKVTIYKNDIPFAGPENFILVFDAFLNKANLNKDDTVRTFILPIQRAAPEYYLDGDKIKIEIRSITEPHFDFYTQIRTELNNAGLFAPPPARVPTNIVNVSAKNAQKDVSGWFGASAISVFESTIEKSKAVEKLNDDEIIKL
ncbi:MAG: DUF4249 domain-containing protein [Pseudarcicella sp.]|jgi:hypothetical protein|nr:DUF4249 domain-containing protein [Pseudarcicella sp.]MBP6410232.1 DUF4249 domain-containing protein [Pseudarcicella sp.]